MDAVISFIVTNLPMLACFLTGIVMLVVEAFMPGFGLPGICGVLLEVLAIAITWFSLGPIAALGMTLIIISLIAIVVSLSLRSVTRGRLSRSNMILKDTESLEAGYRASKDMESFLGLEGETTTVLRPTGMAQFDSVKLNVVSDGSFIPAGQKVKVVGVAGNRIEVKPI